jgi:hypothetical protein
MEIVTHYVDPVDVVYSIQIEPPQVPITGRSGERHSIFDWLLADSFFELFEEAHEVFTVIFVSSAVWRTWIPDECQQGLSKFTPSFMILTPSRNQRRRRRTHA